MPKVMAAMAFPLLSASNTALAVLRASSSDATVKLPPLADTRQVVLSAAWSVSVNQNPGSTAEKLVPVAAPLALVLKMWVPVQVGAID